MTYKINNNATNDKWAVTSKELNDELSDKVSTSNTKNSNRVEVIIKKHFYETSNLSLVIIEIIPFILKIYFKYIQYFSKYNKYSD